MPKVSALIPTRNRPVLVERAIRSVLTQTYWDLEVIVVIDGPDSATVRALSAIDDHRLRIIPLETSVGGAEARNVAARAARGEWVAYLDDDDEWLPNKVAAQLQVAEASSRKNSALVVSKFLFRCPGKPDGIRPRRLPAKNERLCEYMFDFSCSFQTSTFFCARELMMRIPFSKGLKGHQDLDWFLRATEQPDTEFRIVEEALSVYHVPTGRESVGRSFNWRSSLAWGKAERRRMTGLGYSRFVVSCCAVRAVEEKERFRALPRLLYECALVGSPSPKTIGLLFLVLFLNPDVRRKLRDLLFPPPRGPITYDFRSYPHA